MAQFDFRLRNFDLNHILLKECLFQTIWIEVILIVYLQQILGAYLVFSWDSVWFQLLNCFTFSRFALIAIWFAFPIAARRFFQDCFARWKSYTVWRAHRLSSRKSIQVMILLIKLHTHIWNEVEKTTVIEKEEDEVLWFDFKFVMMFVCTWFHLFIQIF